MTKADIIQQWHEDQKPVDPTVFGFEGDGEDYEYEPESGSFYQFQDDEFGMCIFLNYDPIFIGEISNQGELRILMKMLNIK